MALFTNDILLDLVGVLVALLAVLLVYFKRSFQYWEYRGVPYIKPQIPWGNLQPPHRRSIPMGQELSNIYNEAKRKGWKYLGIYSMTEKIFMPVDLDLVKNIMTKDFSHFIDRGFYVNEKDEPITAHLFTIGGTKWRNLRTKFTPTFTSGKMRQMFQTVADCGTVLEKYIEHEINHHEPVDIKNVVACYSTDIIGSCAFGLECNTFKEPDSPFRRYGKKFFMLTRWRSLKFAFVNVFPDLAKTLRVCIFPQDVSEFFTKVVEDTVKYREIENVRRSDFLQMLIEIKNDKEQTGDGKTLTMDEIVAQCFVFFVAGFETSSTTMTFALYQMATHPEIQDRVREEIKSVLEKHNNKVTYDALSELKYMEQVIDETLRMYPAVPFVTRRCVEEYKVPDSEFIMEKGTRIFIPILGIHHDSDIHENPHLFDPDRFTEESKHSRHSYSHIPFGEGPRICIGMRFGMMQTKVGLASILRNFRVKVSSKTAVPLKLSSKSIIPEAEGGIWLDFEKI